MTINKNSRKIKNFFDNYECGRDFNHKKASANWIYLGTHLIWIFLALEEQIRRVHNIIVTIDKCFEAKKKNLK